MTSASKPQYDRVKRVFLAACELEGAARDAFIDGECAGDAALRAEVLRLLEADLEASTGHEAMAAFNPPPPPEELRLIGGAIGGYRIKGILASGGMGTVFEALQDRPRRTVALKIMKRGLASRSALRRFQYEAQILARLRHPGIAQIYEAGVHYEDSVRDGGEGMPFFAMEYIPGARTIIDYCAGRKLPVRERLALFADVCDAVQCGHQQGIIHRDLKPANILVDSSGRPKVIDFGVARATDSDLAVTTAQTDIGQLIGTIRYMSPEQCAADPHDLDIRSDVYSLGVVLYELLTGRPPYDLSGQSVIQATRLISEIEAPRPSSLDHSLRGDIETIVLKALAKERDRRYQSAYEFGADIRRHLANQPIIAHPPSTVYYVTKFARRNKALVAASIVVLLTLIIGFVSVSVSLRNAQLARDEAEEITSFLERMLASVSPEELGRDVLVRDVLDESAAMIGAALRLQPAVEGRLRHTIGVTYKALGEYEEALAQLEQALALRSEALGARHAATLQTRNEVGVCLYRLNRFAESETVFRDTLEARRDAFGDNSLPAFETMHDLGVVIRDSGATLGDASRFDEADPLLRAAVEGYSRLAGADHHDTLLVRNNLGGLLFVQEKYTEARDIFRTVLNIRRRTLGDEHLATIDSMDTLAWTLRQLKEWDEAIELSQRAVEARRRIQGSDHPTTLGGSINLAMMLFSNDRYEEAAQVAYGVYDGWKRRSGPVAEESIRALRFAAVSSMRSGDRAAAENRFTELTGNLIEAGQINDAEAEIRRWLTEIEKSAGSEHVETEAVRNRLNEFLAAHRELAQSTPVEDDRHSDAGEDNDALAPNSADSGAKANGG